MVRIALARLASYEKSSRAEIVVSTFPSSLTMAKAQARVWLQRMSFFAFVLIGMQLPALGEEPVRIGVLTDLSGRAAYLGQKTRIGAEILKQDLAKQGHKIDLIFGDSAFDPAKAVSEAHKLLDIEHVDAVFSNFSPIALSVGPVICAARKLWVYTGAAVSPVAGCRYAFKSYLDYQQGCEAIATAWRARGLKNIGLLKPLSEFGELCHRGVNRVFSSPVVVEYALGQEVRTEVLRLKARQVQAILNATYEGDFVNMLKAMAHLHYHVPLGAEETSFTPQAQREYGAAVDEVLFYAMPTPAAWFIEEVRRFYSSNTMGGIEHAAMAYLHLRQIFESVRACARDNATCQIERLGKSAGSDDFGFLKWGPERVAMFKWALKSRQK